MYNYFLRRLHDHQIAEDLMHTVFERLIKYRKSFDEGKNLRVWLFTIARNVAINEANRKRHNYLEDTATNHIATSSYDTDTRDTMLQAISMLSDDDSELIRMTKIHGFKYKETGQILGMTEANVKVKVHRSMKQLKDILLNKLNYEY